MHPPPKLELVDLKFNYPSTTPVVGAGPQSATAVDLAGIGATPPVRILSAEHTVLLGPSGCGKSTLLRLIAGLLHPTQGTILKDGQPIARPGRDRIMVFQSYTSFPWLTVEENVIFGLRLVGASGWRRSKDLARQHREKALNIIELVGLSDSLEKYPRELSGGMQQRVAIARALVCDPDILLMDEPFGALDPHTRVKMQELTLKIERAHTMTVVFVTHDVREAVFLGDTIYISTLRPCFLKYRLTNPFNKAEIQREVARERYHADFLRFQREVEDRLQYLIEHPELPRILEADDYAPLRRSTFGVLEQLSTDASSV